MLLGGEAAAPVDFGGGADSPVYSRFRGLIVVV